ncbi:MAG TPA: anti-sigma factor [Alphaproteobacteria bacterium]|jgi:anti-sigma factor RsiW|nr:anti-sigma factor [Alphaproteobacteria bacterium]
MTCTNENLLLLHAYLDGELDAANTVHFEDHLETCALCRTELERQREMRRAIRGPGVAHAAPDDLRRRIEAAIAAETGIAEPAPLPKPRSSWWPTAGALALAASLALFLALPQPGPAIQEQLVDSHVHSLLAQHLTDVQASDQHTVRPWFSGKVDVAPPAVDLAHEGFPLVGGRLDYVGNRVVAAMVYKRDQHVINVYVRPASDRQDLSPQAETYRGYNLCQWRQHGTEFWAVTDASRAELEAFAHAYTSANS